MIDYDVYTVDYVHHTATLSTDVCEMTAVAPVPGIHVVEQHLLTLYDVHRYSAVQPCPYRYSSVRYSDTACMIGYSRVSISTCKHSLICSIAQYSVIEQGGYGDPMQYSVIEQGGYGDPMQYSVIE